MLASDGTPQDWLGFSVGICGDNIVIGSFTKYAGSAYIFGLEGSTWEEKLLASDGTARDYFGRSIGISGDTAIIGEGDVNLEPNGSAYIFRFDGSSWFEEAKLLASDVVVADRFGYSVGVSGDTAVIGAEWDDDNGENSGSAYIFRFSGSNWVEEAKLVASDGAAYDWFGYSVSISGDVAVIGTGGDDDNGNFSGSAYIFRFNGSSWGEEAKLVASDGAADDWFGCSAGIFGDTAVIGAYGDNNEIGSAYIFRFNGSIWVQEAKLLASDGAVADRFGWSVSISGDTAVIGAYADDANGSTYIFRFNGSGWVEEAKLLASDGNVGDLFGWSVSISGDTAVIGAYGDNDNGNYSGSAYIFRFDGSNWVEERKLLASDGAADDRFGRSVGISGDTAVVGARQDDDNGDASGSAYIFGLSLNPGDLDFDNDVDFVDYSLFAAYWLEDDCWPCRCARADFNRDWVVDYYDLKELCDNWLAGK